MTIKPEYLLAHADFVRFLSRRLILDEDLADDIAQNTMLAALEKPPTASEALRTWLGIVARNFALSLKRERVRRRAREMSAAQKGYVPSPADVLERETVRRGVVDAVLSLSETYRDPILLRFYEDLPPSKVAEVERIPVETVKTRLKRGLAELRSHLDGVHGGDRNKWCTALAPLAGLKLLSSTGSAAGSGTAAAGSLLPQAKLVLAAAVITLLAGALGLWQAVFAQVSVPSTQVATATAASSWVATARSFSAVPSSIWVVSPTPGKPPWQSVQP